MNKEKDTYLTIDNPSPEILYKDRKSKFFGYVFPITTEDDVKPIIEELKKQHHTANHVCYAWQLGTDNVRYRANDDGEPNNSAGLPIYGQIQAYDLTNVLVAVARIFGGTKLGVGGLISAYRTAAQIALDEAEIKKKIITQLYTLTFDYKDMNSVMRVIKQKKLDIISQKLEANCTYVISVRKTKAEEVFNIFDTMQYIKIQN
ncbi:MULTISPECIES: IMPACT family protein [unclassified Cellulophaga]|uniref:IMPACT family protein n=1 Tax=unclassified Cellulophaga TaxID=2634405 RepID=UPI0026E1239B|nr:MULTISPECIES: YigZ family protein [unclassified Cellulophaga]MDO6490805.1 YigZ family protein [Cellulophaga sp. 2_MG-2023]MDO6494001.1 YigZ family protein [Cellulophaga sp. 3_MG-2023]